MLFNFPRLSIKQKLFIKECCWIIPALAVELQFHPLEFRPITSIRTQFLAISRLLTNCKSSHWSRSVIWKNSSKGTFPPLSISYKAARMWAGRYLQQLQQWLTAADTTDTTTTTTTLVAGDSTTTTTRPTTGTGGAGEAAAKLINLSCIFPL